MKSVSEALTHILEFRGDAEGGDVYFIGTEVLADDFLDAAYELTFEESEPLPKLFTQFPEIDPAHIETMLGRNWFSQKSN